MQITAKFASVCPCCSARITVGSKVEWTRGTPARHVTCTPATSDRPTPGQVAFVRAWGKPGPGRTYAQDAHAYDLDKDF